MRCSTLWMAVWRFIDRPFIEIQCWYHVIDQRHEHGPHGNLLQYFFGYLLPSHRHLWKPIQSKTYVLHVNCFFLQFNENTLTNIQTHRYWGPSGRCINCFSVKLLSEQSTTTLLLLTILSSIQLENEAIFTDSRLIFSVFLLHETDRPLILGLKCTAKKYIIDFKRKNGHVSESIRVQSYRYPNPYPYSSEIQMDWFRKQSNYFKN